MDSFPPAPEPAPHLDDLLTGLDDDADDEPAEAPDLPEVVEAVTGRARDLHRLADRLGGEGGAGDDTLSAVALLRAHAGAVDELAEHLLAARGEDDHAGGPAGRAATVHGPAPASPADDPPPDDTTPRGVPRTVG
ncbi:hypothetical protein ACQPX6_26510 [Actinomycetospora sp. CA-101289]|uniref:hypothetical protein n=1 Tax=Actinomycetospora sp. CA-101289 TaxID=3239893 RepID=UPI003D98B8DC